MFIYFAGVHFCDFLCLRFSEAIERHVRYTPPAQMWLAIKLFVCTKRPSAKESVNRSLFIIIPWRIFGWNSWAADRWCPKLANEIWVISSYLREKYARLSGRPESVRIIPTIID